DVLSVCYDVANAHFIGESLVEGFETLNDRISLIHCSDTTRSAWRHDPVGKGDVPWEDLADVLGSTAHKAPLLLEVIDADLDTAILNSHDALEQHGIFNATGAN